MPSESAAWEPPPLMIFQLLILRICRGGQSMARILIVEDSWYQRMKIRQALQADGHDTLEAADGHTGLEMAATHAPDCILLDLIMPNTGGLEVLEALRERGAKAPVIVLTADIQETTREQCLELGAVRFANKPVKADELRNTVTEVLSSKREPAQ
jgi:CheY-like chemotaxis protein